MNFNAPIRALSWKQPFAELMFHDKVETRTWPTQYRGWVLICASKVPYDRETTIDISGYFNYVKTRNILKFSAMDSKISWTEGNKRLNMGHAVGIGWLHDCQHMRKEDEERCFVNYNPDLYCHIYKNVQRIRPFPYKGKMGWGKVGPEILQQIHYL